MKKIIFVILWTALSFSMFAQAATISGHVMQNGQNANNFPVEIYNTSWELVAQVNTDNSGHYQAQVDPGSYYLYAYSSDATYMPKYYSQYAQAYVYDLATLVSVDGSTNASDIDFTLFISGTLTGNITDSSETALSSFIVKVYDENSNQVSWNVTDENGLYTFNLDPGNYYVVSYDASGFYVNQVFTSLVEIVQSATTSDIDLSLQVAAISVFTDQATYTVGDVVTFSAGMVAATDVVDIYVVLAYPDGTFRSIHGDLSALSLSSPYTLTPLITSFSPIDLNPAYAFYTLDSSSLDSGTYGVYVTLAYTGYYPGYSTNQYAINYNSFTISP